MSPENQNLDFSKVESGQKTLENVRGAKESPEALKTRLLQYRQVYQTEVDQQKNNLKTFKTNLKSSEARNYLDQAVTDLGGKMFQLAGEGEKIQKDAIEKKKASGQEPTEKELNFKELGTLKAELKNELTAEQAQLETFRKLEKISSAYERQKVADDKVNNSSALAGLSGNLAVKQNVKKVIESALKELANVSAASGTFAGDLHSKIEDNLSVLKDNISDDLERGASIQKLQAELNKEKQGYGQIETELAQKPKNLSEKDYADFLARLKTKSTEFTPYFQKVKDAFNVADAPFTNKLEATFYQGIYTPTSEQLQDLYAKVEAKRPLRNGPEEAVDLEQQANLDAVQARKEFAAQRVEAGKLAKELDSIKKDKQKSLDRKVYDDFNKRAEALVANVDKINNKYQFPAKQTDSNPNISRLAKELTDLYFTPTLAATEKVMNDNKARESELKSFETKVLNDQLATMLPQMDASWQANINDQKKFLAQPSTYDEKSPEFQAHLEGEKKMLTYLVSCESQVNLVLSKKDSGINWDNQKRFEEYRDLCKKYLDQITANRAHRKMLQASAAEQSQEHEEQVKVGTKKIRVPTGDRGPGGMPVTEEMEQDVYETRKTTYKFTDCVEFIDPSDPNYSKINDGKGWKYKNENLPQDIKDRFALQAARIVTESKKSAEEESFKDKQKILRENKLYDMVREDLGDSAKDYFAAVEAMSKGNMEEAVKLFRSYLENAKSLEGEILLKHKPYIEDAFRQIDIYKGSAEFYAGMKLIQEGKLDEALPKFREYISRMQKLPEAEQKKFAEQLNAAIEILRKINATKLAMLVELKNDLKYAGALKVANALPGRVNLIQEIKKMEANSAAISRGEKPPYKNEDIKIEGNRRAVILPYLPYDQLTETEKKMVADGRGGLTGQEIQDLESSISDLQKKIEKGEPLDFEAEMKAMKEKMAKYANPKNSPGAATFSDPESGERKVDTPTAHLFGYFDKINSTDPKVREKGFVAIADHFKDQALGMKYTQKYLAKAMVYQYEDFEKTDNGATKKEVTQKMLGDKTIAADINKAATEYYKRWVAEENAKLPPGEKPFPLNPPDPFVIQRFQTQIFDQKFRYQYEREMRKKMTDRGLAVSGSALERFNTSLPYNDGSARWYKPWSWSDYNEDDWTDFKEKAAEFAVETIVTLPIGMGAGAIGRAVGRGAVSMLMRQGLKAEAIALIEEGGIMALRANSKIWEGLSPVLKQTIMAQRGRILAGYTVGLAAEGTSMLLMNSIWEGVSSGRTPEIFRYLDAKDWKHVSVHLLESIAKAGAFRAIGAAQGRIGQAIGAEGSAAAKAASIITTEAFSGFAGTGLEALTLLAKGQGDQITFDFWARSLIQNALQSYGTHKIHTKTEKAPSTDKKLEARFKAEEVKLINERLEKKGITKPADISEARILPGGEIEIRVRRVEQDGTVKVETQKLSPTELPVAKLPPEIQKQIVEKVTESKKAEVKSQLEKSGVTNPEDIASVEGNKIKTKDGQEITITDPSLLPDHLQTRFEELRRTEVKDKVKNLQAVDDLFTRKTELEKDSTGNAEALAKVNTEIAAKAKERGLTPEALAERNAAELRMFRALDSVLSGQQQIYRESKVVKVPVLKEDGSPLLDAQNNPVFKEVNLFEHYESKTSAYSGDLLHSLDYQTLVKQGGSKIIKIGGDELVVYHAGADGHVQKLFIDISNMGPTNDTATNMAGSRVNLVDIYLHKISLKIKEQSSAHQGKELDSAKFNAEILKTSRELFNIDHDAAGHPLPEAEARAKFDQLKKEWNLDGDYAQYKADVDSMRILAEYRADTRSLDASYKGKKGVTFSEHIAGEIQNLAGMPLPELQKLIADHPEQFKALIAARVPPSGKLRGPNDKAPLSADQIMVEIANLKAKSSKPEDLMMLYSLLARIDASKMTDTPALKTLADRLGTARTEMVGEPPHARVEEPRLMDAKVVSIDLPPDIAKALSAMADADPVRAHAILTAARTLAEKPLDSLKYQKNPGFARFDITQHIEIQNGKIVIKKDAREFREAVEINLKDKKVRNIVEVENRLKAARARMEGLRQGFESGQVEKAVFDAEMVKVEKEMAVLENRLSIDPDTGAYSQVYLDAHPTRIFTFDNGVIPADYRIWHSTFTELSHAGVINAKYGYLSMDNIMSAYHQVLRVGIAAELPAHLQHFKIIRSGGGKFEVVFLDARAVDHLAKKGLTPDSLVQRLAAGPGQKAVDNILNANPEAAAKSKTDAAVRNSQFKYNKGTPQLEVGKLTVTADQKPLTPSEIRAVQRAKPNASAREIIADIIKSRPPEKSQSEESGESKTQENPKSESPQVPKADEKPKLTPAEIAQKINSPIMENFLEGVLASSRTLTPAEQQRLDVYVNAGRVPGDQLVGLIESKKVPFTEYRLTDLLLEARESRRAYELVLKQKEFTPHQQVLLATNILDLSKSPLTDLSKAIESGQLKLVNQEVFKYLIDSPAGLSAVSMEVHAGRFTPNEAYVQKMLSTREGWQIYADPALNIQGKVPPEVLKALGPEVERRIQVYQDSDMVFRLSASADFRLNLDKAITAIEQNQVSPDNQLGQILQRFRERDPRGFEIVKANKAEVNREFLQSIIDSNFIEITEAGGQPVRAYFGKAVGEGGMGTVRLTAFTRGADLKLQYGVIKTPHKNKTDVFSLEQEGAKTATSWDSPYINKALVISDQAIIYETGRSPEKFSTAVTKSSPQTALNYLDQLISGLQVYRDHSSIHADIKPANVLIMDMGHGPQVVIIDNTPHHVDSITPYSTIPHTASYSPDQVTWAAVRDNPHEYSGVIDAYALGKILGKMSELPKFSVEHRQKLAQLAKDCQNVEKSKMPDFLKEVQAQVRQMIATADTQAPTVKPDPTKTPESSELPRFSLESSVDKTTEVKTEAEPAATATHFTSQFTDKLPPAILAEGKASKDVAGYIDQTGRIFYNSDYFEARFGVKLIQKNSQNVFVHEGKEYSPKQFFKTELGKRVLVEMKNVKRHETAHRYLELLDQRVSGKVVQDLQKTFAENPELANALTKSGRTATPRDIQEFLAEVADGTQKISDSAKSALEKAISTHSPGFRFDKVVQLDTTALATARASELTREFADTKYKTIPPLFNLIMQSGTLVEDWRVTGVHYDGSLIVSAPHQQPIMVSNSAELLAMIDHAAREAPKRAIPEHFELSFGPSQNQKFFNAQVQQVNADSSIMVICYSKLNGAPQQFKFNNRDHLLGAIEHPLVTQYDGLSPGSRISLFGSRFDGATILMIKANGDVTMTLAQKPGEPPVRTTVNIYEIRAEQRVSIQKSDRLRSLLLDAELHTEPGSWTITSGKYKGYTITEISSTKIMLRKESMAVPIDIVNFAAEVGGISKPPRNDVLRPLNEVPRSTEVLAVGDLHGNGKIFVENLKSLNIVNTNADFSKPDSITWTGGNRRVVFHGDILADRGTDSLQIMASIRKLQAEARAAGGEVTLLAGNHEDFAIAFLTGKAIAGGQMDAFNACFLSNQGAGVIEFINKYSSDPRLQNAKNLEEVANTLGLSIMPLGPGKKIIDPTDPNNSAIIGQLRQDIMANMRGKPEGKDLLEQMSNMKVGEYINDTLFLHTDPTPEIIDLINRHGSTVGEAIDNINNIYRQGLRFHLLGIGTEPADFTKIKDAFTDTSNRTSGGADPYATVDVSTLKAKGLNRIIHGHSSDAANNVVNRNGVEITSVDFDAGKKGGNMDQRSVGKIGLDGSLTVGTEVNAAQRIADSLATRGTISERIPDKSYLPPHENGQESTYIDRKNDTYLKQIISEVSTLRLRPPDQKVAGINAIMAKYTNFPDSFVNAAKLSGNQYLGEIIRTGSTGPRHRALLYQILANEVGLQVTVRRGYLNGYMHSWNEINMGNGQVLVVDASKMKPSGSPTMFYSGALPKIYYTDISGQPLYLNPQVQTVSSTP